tara:strand:- start:260 stop:508 length:249 start_codon:yes stop_codon:yes gene_type:complete
MNTKHLKSWKDSDSQNTEITYSEKNMEVATNLTLNKNLGSIKSSNWLISLGTVALAFAIVPLFPILLAFVAGHWLSKQGDKK